MERNQQAGSNTLLRVFNTVLLFAACMSFAACGGGSTPGTDTGVWFAPMMDSRNGDVTAVDDAKLDNLVNDVGEEPGDSGHVGLEIVDLIGDSEGGVEADSQVDGTLPEDIAVETACAPICAGFECGDDGCGGECGTCPLAAPECVDHFCQIVCEPDCISKECGEDGCGGSCGNCPPEFPDCIDFQCSIICEPECEGKECGDDGCSGECGTCPLAAPLCEEHLCTVVCQPDCVGKECGDNGCGTLCGSCPEDLPICQDGSCLADPLQDGCSEVLKQIFLVTEAKAFLRFEPETLSLIPIGVLNCGAAWGETPYSMSVDRDANAWVLYSDGTLWKVNTEDASCQATAFVPYQQGLELFGMGFSTDGPNTTDETLYIAGGDSFDLLYGDATLGRINLDSMSVVSISAFAAGSRLPELTGTRDAELWGFFPQTSPPRIARINKTNASQSMKIDLPSQFFANVQAWAFAHWGGDYYIFFKSDFDLSSSIWRVAGGSGLLTQELATTGHMITGAGVSTCAPTGNGQ
jgi:hypothetical protein